MRYIPYANLTAVVSHAHAQVALQCDHVDARTGRDSWPVKPPRHQQEAGRRLGHPRLREGEYYCIDIIQDLWYFLIVQVRLGLAMVALMSAAALHWAAALVIVPDNYDDAAASPSRSRPWNPTSRGVHPMGSNSLPLVGVGRDCAVTS